MEPTPEAMEAERCLRVAIEAEERRQGVALEMADWRRQNPYPAGPESAGRPYGSVSIYFEYRARQAEWREQIKPFAEALAERERVAEEAARSAAEALYVEPGDTLDIRVTWGRRILRVILDHRPDSSASVSLRGTG